MFVKFSSALRLLLLSVVALSMAMLGACGSSSDNDVVLSSSDASKIYVSQNGSVTVSGLVIDAVKRTLVSGATVSIRIDGHIYTVTSAPATHASPGSFSFLLAKADSDFLISVSMSDGSYAPNYYAETTTDIGNTGDIGVLTLDIGSVELYKPVSTSVTVKNISDGSPVTGLTLYLDPQAVAQANAGDSSVEVTIEDVVATEGTTTDPTTSEVTPTGIYTFSMPDDGKAYTIKVKELMDTDSVEYKGYNATITNNILTTLTAGADRSFYLTTTGTQDYTIFVHLVDENGDAYDAGESIVLYKTTDTVPIVTGVTEPIYAERVASTTNEYMFMTTAATLDFTILNMDTDGNGFPDTGAVQLTVLNVNEINDNGTPGDTSDDFPVRNILGDGAFNADREATVTVAITAISPSQDISAELISGVDHFQVGGLAQLIFAFDRPVEVLHEVRMRAFTVNEATVNKAVESPAQLFTNSTGTTTTLVGNGAGTVTRNGTVYDYVLDDATAATVTITGLDANGNTLTADATGNVVSPYETDFEGVSTVSVIAAANYAFSANNTVLTITLPDSSVLLANQQYTFEFAVRGTQADTPIAFISQLVSAKTNVAIADLTDFTKLWVDDFNFKNTPTRVLTNVSAETFITGQSDHLDLYLTLPTATYDGTNSPVARYLRPTGLSLATIDSKAVAVHLVSKAKLSGSVEVVSKIEKYLDSAGTEITSTAYSSLGEFYTLDYSSTSAIVTDDTDLTNLQNIVSVKKYLTGVPSDHGIDDADLQNVYGGLLTVTDENADSTSTVVSSGANISSDGVYYIYTIPVSTNLAGTQNYISSVDLNFNVSVNGSSTALTGVQTYPVN